MAIDGKSDQFRDEAELVSLHAGLFGASNDFGVELLFNKTAQIYFVLRPLIRHNYFIQRNLKKIKFSLRKNLFVTWRNRQIKLARCQK